MLTTCHPNDIAASSKKDKDGNSVMKLTCVLEHNKCMGESISLISNSTPS